jgi:hypothetical protein
VQYYQPLRLEKPSNFRLVEKPNNRDALFLIDQRAAEQAVWFEVNGSEAELRLSDYLPNLIREQLSLTPPLSPGHR